jgi:hypothetical protein
VASARVVEVSRKGQITVDYRTADGRQVRAAVRQGDESRELRPRVGDEIPIEYDPQDPTSKVHDTRVPFNSDMKRLSLGVALLAAVAVPLTTWALVRARRRERTSTG